MESGNFNTLQYKVKEVLGAAVYNSSLKADKPPGWRMDIDLPDFIVRTSCWRDLDKDEFM